MAIIQPTKRPDGLERKHLLVTFSESNLKMQNHPVIRDVADFHLRWQEFRPTGMTILKSRSLTPDEIKVLTWMIELIDRVGPQDVEA